MKRPQSAPVLPLTGKRKIKSFSADSRLLAEAEKKVSALKTMRRNYSFSEYLEDLLILDITGRPRPATRPEKEA